MVGNKVILRNIGILTIAQALSLAAGIGTAALLARNLGPGGYGVLGFGTACLGFLGVAVALGTDTYGVREVARARESVCRVIGDVTGLRLALAVLVYAGFCIFVLLLDRPGPEKAVLAVQGAGVFVIALTLDYAFQGLERMGVNGFRQVATAFLTLAGVVLFVNGPDDLIEAAGIVLGAGMTAVLVVGAFARGRLGPTPLVREWGVWRRVLAVSAPMAVSGVTHTIIANTDVVMLGLMRTNTEVGLYSAAFRVMAVGMVPGGLVLAAFFPNLAAAFKDGPEAMRRSSTAFAATLAMIGAPVAFGGILFADDILAVLYGDAFVEAAPVLMLLLGSVFVWHLRAPMDSALLAWNAERLQMKINLAGAGVNVALNLALIPAYGVAGAAVASLLSHIVLAIVFALAFRRFAERLPLAPAFSALVCVVPAAAAAWVFRAYGLPALSDGGSPLVSLLSGGGLFGAVYILAFVVYRWRAHRATIRSEEG